ncbi:EI24 domain-containing protein [Helicobacter bizzozeronii]|uniref:EI24 domain-containing protein n=1 Tax=Helicobacter bizzozeronii TaxID=56877 RepID=UPI000CEE2E39|nr:EI24 domain-containing protein [Helicobacter bizzozeronii]
MKSPLQTIRESWRDFFSWKMVLLNIAPVLIGLLFWGGLLFYFGGNIVRILEGFLPTSWYHYAHSGGFLPAMFLLVFKAFVYVLVVLVVLILSLVGNVLFALFYTPIVLRFLQQKYYPQVALESFGDLYFCLQYFLKQLAFLGLFLLVCIPLYFIPFIGIFFSLIPHYFFFKNTMSFDIASSLFNQQDYQRIQKDYKIATHKIAILSYLFSLIPVFNFFATLLQTIILSRHFLEIKSNKNLSQPPAQSHADKA